jgi:hypothetical protein
MKKSEIIAAIMTILRQRGDNADISVSDFQGESKVKLINTLNNMLSMGLHKGGKKVKVVKAEKPKNAWLAHLAEVRKANKGLSVGETAKLAAESYKK